MSIFTFFFRFSESLFPQIALSLDFLLRLPDLIYLYFLFRFSVFSSSSDFLIFRFSDLSSSSDFLSMCSLPIFRLSFLCRSRYFRFPLQLFRFSLSSDFLFRFADFFIFRFSLQVFQLFCIFRFLYLQSFSSDCPNLLCV